MSSENINLRIRVTNTESNVVFVHSKVPLRDVEILRLSPNLKIEVLGQSRTEDERTSQVNS